MRAAAPLAVVLLCLTAACSAGSSGGTTPPTTSPAPSSAVRTPPPSSSIPAAPSSTPATPSRSRATSAPSTTPSTRAAAGAPVIVIDPGHSRTVSGTYRGLDVSDYENEPEMRDVFSVAQLVATQLRAAGYRVVLTKTSVDQRIDLAQRALIANDAHAALALSIHDQAGSNGGIGFRAGNNTVYYQSVGDYRATPSGRRVHFTDKAVAALSKKYAAIFGRERRAIEGTSVTVHGDVGYDLGSRGLAAGNIWLVQLLSDVPWIYNEAGGNSAGQVGLNAADKATYARALVASVEQCVPIR